VLVTGASTGIGEQMAYHYARFGAEIVITARREKVLQQVRKLGMILIIHQLNEIKISHNKCCMQRFVILSFGCGVKPSRMKPSRI